MIYMFSASLYGIFYTLMSRDVMVYRFRVQAFNLSYFIALLFVLGGPRKTRLFLRVNNFATVGSKNAM